MPVALTRWIYRRRLAGVIKPDARARFTLVYKDRRWESPESHSGPGSERSSDPVRHTLRVLNTQVPELGIRSLADIACGDFNWMPMFLGEHPEVAYAGYDVVTELVQSNRQRYPMLRFSTLDITRHVPDRADLILCKDLLNHLDEVDVWKALDNMVRSGATYLLVTSNQGHQNSDLSPRHPHGSRHLNLRAAPYDFPEPLYQDHYLSLWAIKDLVGPLKARRTH